MSKVVLHIGTHKTATTTIQDVFARNAKLLAEHGLIYPKLGRAAGHHGLVMDWSVYLPKIYGLPGGSLASLRRIAADHAAGSHTVFLSSEEFSRGTDTLQVDFSAVREALSGFDDIEVVCVLREQWQFVQSIYLEVSKIRVPPRPPLFVETVLKDDLIEGLWTDYNLLYDLLLKSFPPEAITFLDFDDCRASEGGILGRMLAYLGVDLAPAALELVNEGRSNASPLPLPAFAANLVAEPKVAPAWLVEATTGAFQVQFGQKARSQLWTREEYRVLRDYAQDRNGRLSDRLLPYQPGFAVHATNQREGDIYREDLRADFWVRSNRWLFGATQRKGGPG
ncbi:MAG: hypothetical protein WAT09_02155 [Paracoccaceae bacterium]